LIETFSKNYNFSTIHFQITWYGCDISFPYCLLKYNILQKYPMSSLKKLVITGGPFTKKTQETLAKMMPNTQILNCYGKINQIVKVREIYYSVIKMLPLKKSIKYYKYIILCKQNVCAKYVLYCFYKRKMLTKVKYYYIRLYVGSWKSFCNLVLLNF